MSSTTSQTRPAGTQYRQFNYDLTTMRLMSTVNPENGTVSYAYNTDGTLASKTDNMTPHQVTRFTYDPTWKRVSKIEFCLNPTQTNCANRTFTYGTTGTQWGRLRQVNWDGATFVGADGYNRSAAYSQVYSYMGSGLVTLKRLQSVKTTGTTFGPVTTTTNFDLNYTYDSEARMVTMKYPGAVNPSDPNDSSGRTYTYTFDPMGRPYSLRDDQQTPSTWVTSATYNAAGQMAGMQSVAGTETRQYNAMLQTTRITAPGMDMQYSYTAGVNNGQITQAIDGASGETITYQYDQLKRLSGASSYATNGATWSQNYQYDGFGNLTGKTPGGSIQPVAPTMTMTVNAATNRLLWPGVAESTTYDANGNLIYNPSTGATYTYDVENRMTTATGYASGGVPVQETYIYGPDNKRMYRLKYNTVSQTPISEEIFVYGLGGEKLATYGADPNGSTYSSNGTKLYFAGKLISAPQGASVDRLGSVRSGGTRYYPYGEEFGGAAVQEGQQFATYSRDGNTGLDYADQRYYNSMWGRFMTADPYQAGSGSGDPTDPASWNRYAYTLGDPVNELDPSGLSATCPDCIASVTGYATRPDVFSFPQPGIGQRFYSGEIESDLQSQGRAERNAERVTVDRDPNADANRSTALHAFRRVTRLLVEDQDCRDFLKSGIASGLEGLFRKYLEGLPDLIGSGIIHSSVSVGTLNGVRGSYGSGYNITLNANGAFFNSGVGVGYAEQYDAQVRAIGGGSPAAQNFILLHELAHFFGASQFIEDDKGRAAQMFNNDLLYGKCRRTILGIGGVI